MAKLNSIGESIECDKSQIAVRKCQTNNPQLVKYNNGKLKLFKYKSSIRSIAIILKELPVFINDDGEEQKWVILPSSYLSEGDKLECDIMEIYTKERLPNPMPVESNFSHVHGIQGHIANCFTFAKIHTPWRFVLEQINLPTALPSAK